MQRLGLLILSAALVVTAPCSAQERFKTTEDADRHMAGYDALLDATVKAGQAAGLLSGGAATPPAPYPTA